MRSFLPLLFFTACSVTSPNPREIPAYSDASPKVNPGFDVAASDPKDLPKPDIKPEEPSQNTKCPAPPAPTCVAVALESFETDTAGFTAADWATATQDSSGAPAVLTRVLSGATDGNAALSIPLRMNPSGYAQGYVGKSIQRSLTGCARVSFDLTLPAIAPAGLRAKGILHLAGEWSEPEASVPLQPGATITVDVPLAAGFGSLPPREAYAALTAIGVKIDGTNVSYNGPVYLDHVRVAPNWPRASEDQNLRAVGTFGGFVRAAGDDIPQGNGFLTFAADAQAGRHALRWPKLGPNDGDFMLVESRFGNAPAGGTLSFGDHTTVQAETLVSDGGSSHSVRVVMSRVFPATRYTTTAKHVAFVTKKDARARMRGLTLVRNGVVETLDLGTTTSVSTAAMSEPWIVLFAGGATGWPFDAPILITFQTKPSGILVTSDGIEVSFASAMGALHVMPLHGLQRFAASTAWLSGLPTDSVALARALVPKLLAFPTRVVESSTSDATEVHITEALTHSQISDAWGTTPEPAAVLPPLIAQAQNTTYPIRVDGAVQTLNVPTFYGPFAFVPGSSVTYHLPLPAGVSRVEIPLRVINNTLADTVHEEVKRVIREQVADTPADFYLDGDDRGAQFLCEAYATLDPLSPEAEKARLVASKFIEHGWLDASLQTLVEPVTHQRYLNNAKYWASTEPFDKEWYTGRQLAALAACAQILNLDLARGAWPKVLGLYRYNRIFFDWSIGTALSSVFGFTALIDGLYFSWDGMIGVARLAKALGDTEIYEDAVYRAARQQVTVFMLWHHAQWAKSLDYGIGHISGKKGEVETRGAIDGFVEDYGAATLQFESLWQTANAIAFDVLPQFALYRDFGIAPRLHALTFDIMPLQHPNWLDGNVMDPVDSRYYGSINTAFHLTARAAMFHSDPQPLYDAYQASAGTMASQQWYSMRWHGVSGPMLLAIQRAIAPSVEVPLGSVRPRQLTYDASSDTLRFEGAATSDGAAMFRISTEHGSRDVTLDVCSGQSVSQAL